MSSNPTAARTHPSQARPRASLLLATLLLPLVGSGCGSWTALTQKANPPAFQPANHFAQFERLPAFVRRVAILPIAVPAENWYASDGRPQLEPVLKSELGKLNRFEMSVVTEQQLRSWTGRGQWGTHEDLPPDLFERLRKETGCDAVLFSNLSPYRPYRPMVMGWNFRLIDARLRSVLWAAEEVFDSGQADVSVAARRYYEKQSPDSKEVGDSERILLSPSRFSQYTLHAVLASMPQR